MDDQFKDSHSHSEEQQRNGVLHLSNGAIITLIVMVILTFISLLGLLGLYFLCPRRRPFVIRPAQQQQLNLSNFSGIRPISKQGLEAEDIDKLPLLSYAELVGVLREDQTLGCSINSSGCAVCLAEFSETEENKIRFLPNCHHCFHPQCVDKWLRSSASCPLCRSNLLPPQGDDATALQPLAIAQDHLSSV